MDGGCSISIRLGGGGLKKRKGPRCNPTYDTLACLAGSSGGLLEGVGGDVIDLRGYWDPEDDTTRLTHSPVPQYVSSTAVIQSVSPTGLPVLCYN